MEPQGRLPTALVPASAGANLWTGGQQPMPKRGFLQQAVLSAVCTSAQLQQSLGPVWAAAIPVERVGCSCQSSTTCSKLVDWQGHELASRSTGREVVGTCCQPCNSLAVLGQLPNSVQSDLQPHNRGRGVPTAAPEAMPTTCYITACFSFCPTLAAGWSASGSHQGQLKSLKSASGACQASTAPGREAGARGPCR